MDDMTEQQIQTMASVLAEEPSNRMVVNLPDNRDEIDRYIRRALKSHPGLRVVARRPSTQNHFNSIDVIFAYESET